MKELVTLFSVVFFCSHYATALDETRPDVLFIVIDDLNDWTTLHDANAPIDCPNIARLANRGMWFSRAYCMSPACNPSRAATLTGLRPTTTGVYGNKSDWRAAVGDRKTIMQQFQSAGYRVTGAGKIFHHHLNGAFHDDASFHEFRSMRPQLYPSQKLNDAPEYGSRNTDWGAWPPAVEQSIDYQTVDFVTKQFAEREFSSPRFLACGIFKPHSPFFAPVEFHQQAKEVPFPDRRVDDWQDLPSGAEKLMKGKKWFWTGMSNLNERQPDAYQNFVRSYAACVRFADDQVGKVIDALDASGRRDRTIVVLWSDHGFHLGEKDHIEKFALWEKSNRIPFLIVAPGVTRPHSTCDRPIDMSVLYPTLLDLCGLPADARCDGKTLVPILRNPAAAWERPALMTYLRGNHAVRSDRWRYIRYADGSEELYDHQSDPHEWHNLAGEAKYMEVIDQHRAWLPESESQQVPDLRPDKG